MKKCTVHLTLTFILLSVFSFPSVADILGDFNKATDIIKQAGEIIPNRRNTSPPPAATSPAQPNQQSQNASAQQNSKFIFTHPERYFERGPLLNTLGIDIGEVTIIKPLDKNTFKSLYVPSYRGIPRLGLTPDYPNITGTADAWKKHSVKAFLHDDMTIYHNLRLLALMEKHTSEKNLKIDKRGTPEENSGNLRGGLYTVQALTRPAVGQESELRLPRYTYLPRWHIESLAAATLLPKSYNQYFCDSEPCDGNHFPRVVGNWGGFNQNNNNIKEHKAYFNFVETEVRKLKSWAKSLSDEVYITGSVIMPKYDFKRQGFELSLFQPTEYGASYWYVPRGKGMRVFSSTGEKQHAFFFSINEAEAEALQSKLQTTPNGAHTQIYFAVKGKIYNPAPAATGFERHSPTSLGARVAYDTTGSAIEFFSDELLTNKLFDAKIN